MSMAMKIKKLINNGQWEEIFELIKLDNIDDIDLGNIASVAAAGGQKRIIQYLLKSKPKILEKFNNNGNSAIHILASYGYIDLLKECLTVDVNFINLLNKDDENVLLILYDNLGFLRWTIDMADIDNFNVIDSFGLTVLLKNLFDSKKEGDNGYEIIKILLDHGVDVDYPKNDPPLIIGIRIGKDYIVNLLLKYDIDVNIKDGNLLTPFLYAVKVRNHQIIQKLIDHGADVQYSGPENDLNPMIGAIIYNDEKIIETLLNSGFDVNKFDRYLETPLHYALRQKGLSPTLIGQLLYHGDLNIANIKKQTPLHLLLKNHNWKDYDQFLYEKDLDIFVLDTSHRYPFQYLLNNSLFEFIDLVLKGYMRRMNIDRNEKYFMNTLKQFIFTTKNSIYANNQMIPINVLNKKYVNHGLFNSDTLHSIVYTLIILKRYANVFVPFQFYNFDIHKNEAMVRERCDLYYGDDLIISDLVRLYSEYVFELLPYLILWKGRGKWYVNKYVDFLVMKVLRVDNIRFVFFKLTLILPEGGTHANVVIFDKKSGILERFDPYGDVPYLDVEGLDVFVKEEIGKIFSDFLGDRKMIYLNPRDLFGGIGFQVISNDGYVGVKKLGDPSGFCLAWIFWYLEMRVNNANIHPTKLIRYAIRKIVNNMDSKEDTIFIDFIRNYAAYLDKLKNDLFIDANIAKRHLYDLVLDNENRNKVLRKLIREFMIIAEHFVFPSMSQSLSHE